MSEKEVCVSVRGGGEEGGERVTCFATSAHWSPSLPREGKSSRRITPPTVKPDHTGTVVY